MARRDIDPNLLVDKDLKVTEVYFERVFNLWNYQTFRLGLHGTVGPDQSYTEVISKLDKAVLKARKEQLSELGQ